MSKMLNLQVAGVPLITYGLIGVTTAILAYATLSGGVGNTDTKAEDKSASKDETAEDATKKEGESVKESPATEGEQPKEGESEPPAPAPEPAAEGEQPKDGETTGGKRRRHKRKTPKSKKGADCKKKSRRSRKSSK